MTQQNKSIEDVVEELVGHAGFETEKEERDFYLTLIRKSKEEARRQMIREFYLANEIMATTNPLAVLNGILTAEEMEYGRSLSNTP